MYEDFQELLAQKDINGVYNVAPDHWHVSMLLRSLKAGQHVHVEKPLGVSIEQDLAAVKAVRKFPKQVCLYGAELRALPEAKKGIEQDLAAVKAVRKFPKQVCLYGAELRALPEAKKGIELVLNGRIGKVQKIYVVSPANQAGGSGTPGSRTE